MLNDDAKQQTPSDEELALILRSYLPPYYEPPIGMPFRRRGEVMLYAHKKKLIKRVGAKTSGSGWKKVITDKGRAELAKLEGKGATE